MAKSQPIFDRKPIVVKNLFDESSRETIKRFLDEVCPLLPLGSDLQEPDSPSKFGRRWYHNPPYIVDIHHELSQFASDVFQEKVKPSYSFLSMYEANGICPLHIDRPQCRYTIDYLIEKEKPEPWPILIGNELSEKERNEVLVPSPSFDEDIDEVISQQTWTTCHLDENDAVCYSGTHCWHYRPERSTGKVSLVFFHFVPATFKGDIN